VTDIRIAVIGYGNMGRGHAAYLNDNRVPGAVLGAIVDIDPAVLGKAREAYPHVGHFESTAALIESKSVDAVIVATPHYFHPPLAIDALNAGLHALIEKPAGAYSKQVRELNAVAEKSDKVFGIMFNQRTNGANQKLRELVQSGELGEIKRTQYVISDWFRSQQYYDSGGWRATWAGEGGGVLLNQAPHNLDLWQWICGMPKRVRAFCGFGRYHDIEVEDDVTAYVEYENGATGVFVTTTGEAPGSKFLEISADRGKVVLRDGKLTFYRTTEPVSKFLRETPFAFSQPEVWTIDIPWRNGEDHVGITKNWVDSIVNGTPLLAPGIEGIHGTELANAMLLSAWTDSWVDLPLDDDLYFAELQKRVATGRKKDVVEAKTFDLSGSYSK